MRKRERSREKREKLIKVKVWRKGGRIGVWKRRMWKEKRGRGGRKARWKGRRQEERRGEYGTSGKVRDSQTIRERWGRRRKVKNHVEDDRVAGKKRKKRVEGETGKERESC